MANENLGPAERIIQTLLTFSDHLVHNRPGVIVKDPSSPTGIRWTYATYKEEKGEKNVYRLEKVGKKTVRHRVGVLQPNNQIKDGDRTVSEWRPAGIQPETAAWMYRQVAEVWKLDNEFTARWASYEFGQDHRDLKVVLAAFMLCQTRKGDPVLEQGKLAFYDEDYRGVGEAMMLLYTKDKKSLDPKMLLRIYHLLSLPSVSSINRELGFGRSARNAFLGRWDKAVHKWLEYREENPKLLAGLVKGGFRTTVMDLARISHYKPTSTKFFETLRWKQNQAKDGRRTLAIGLEVAAAETWEGLSEEQVCQRIMKDKPGFKRLSSLVPKNVGITRAVFAAAIEAGCLSDKDLIIATPTLEDLGLLEVQDVRERWEKATKSAEDMRAANIASRVKSKVTQEKLQETADTALKKAVEEVTRGLQVFFVVDISGSMHASIEQAKSHVARFLQGFPADRLHVSVFNTQGREIKIQHASAAGVDNAFRGIMASGGTDHGAGVRILSKHAPAPDEDALFIFVGDEGQVGTFEQSFSFKPMAFGLIKVAGDNGSAVRDTANRLGIPCFSIDERTFADPYAIPRTIRALVASTPVGQTTYKAAPRVTLVDTILKTEILRKPAFAL